MAAKEFTPALQNTSNVPFCPQCATILELPSSGAIVCTQCGYTCRFRDLPGGGHQLSRSAPKPEPEWVVRGPEERDEEC